MTLFGDRMKRYEAATHFMLPRRTYTIVRVDGKAFHSYLAYAEKPFDKFFAASMNHVGMELCKGLAGAQFAYIQSDEASVLLTDFQALDTEPYAGGVLQKLCSISASIATAEFNYNDMPFMSELRHPALFDSRVFTIPEQVETANYFAWRQADAVSNSIRMAARAYFPSPRLEGVSNERAQEMLFREKNVNWNDYPKGFKRGRVCSRTPDGSWSVSDAPYFIAQPGTWLSAHIPALPSLEHPA